MPRCLLALGANLGNRERTLQMALCELAELPYTRLIARSHWHETSPVGGPADQHSFLNGAVVLDTGLEALELANHLQAIEAQHGRERKIRWAARTLDIDLLLYGRATIDTPELTIPHPRMTFRRFVLAPAAEIAGHMVVTGSGWTIAALLNHLLTATRYVALAAADPQHADWLASQLCQRLNASRLEDFFPIAREEDDSHLVSALEWQKHRELLMHLDPAECGSKTSLAPVISGFWHPAEKSRHSTACVQPALVIAVDPPSQESFNVRIGKEKAGIKSHEFHELLCRPSWGPLARITASNPEVAIDEAMAAIQAALSD